jgi:hypothetical protein
MVYKVPNKKVVSVNFSRAVISYLFTLDVVMQALVRLNMVQCFCAVWFSTSYANLRGKPHLAFE